MKDIRNIFRQLDIPFSPSKEDALINYMEDILLLNESINLTAITDREEFINKHYVDSLLCARLDEFRKSENIIDIGTGAGFPGVPLAIAFPEKKFLLVDSLNKRIKIINELCIKHGITNVTAVHGRAEELARRDEFRGQFDLCVSRAVANLSTLSEYCIPFVRTRGNFIAYKGPECDEEVKAAAKAINLLGAKLKRIEIATFDNTDFDHRLVVIEKIKTTPSKYPRKAGTPSKEPIS